MPQPPSSEALGEAAPATLPFSDLRWYLNRLRCMPLREIPFRVVRTLLTRAEGMGLRKYEAVAPDLTQTGMRWVQPPVDIDARPYLAAADRIMAGHFDVFALRDAQLGTPPRWNRDPRTGTEAPLTFGKQLDYRNPALVGDIKYLWEPNRHLQLVTLAQAQALCHAEARVDGDGDDRYGRAALDLIDSWIEACPYPQGANWSSSLEPALRLINWSVAWQLLGGLHSPLFADARGARVRDRWIASVHQHLHFVRGFLSRHSSANNHLIGELSGLLVGAVTWPYWPDSASLLRKARAELLREALLQNAPDGVNREQATCYQQFELDMLLVDWLAARAAGADFPREFTQRLVAMLEYMASIMDAGGNMPMIGDADDGRVLVLSQEEGFCPWRSQLATGAVVFNRGDFAAKAGLLDHKTRWLLGPQAGARFREAAADAAVLPVRREFRDGGYYIIGCDFETDRELRVVVDAGPIGYGAIAAHGHADALAFTLSLCGREMLVDPGTFTYRADSPWRRYFRGTSAHNTLRVDGLDQSEPGGSFLWTTKARAGCDTWRSNGREDFFQGWHDGYRRLADPVMHRRRILLDKARRRLHIDDRLEMKGAHDIELFFHFAESCTVTAMGPAWLAERDGLRLRLALPGARDAEVRLCRGEHEPAMGWVSRSFDVKVPSPTLAWRARLKGPVLLRTVIDC
jgi:hypothetical protein